jgi:hypothetical protein
MRRLDNFSARIEDAYPTGGFMSLLDLQHVLSGLAGGATAGVVGYVFRAMLDHVLAERRERSAQEHRRALQQEEFRHALRMASLDRWLQTHQEAFALWRGRLLATVHQREEVGAAAYECEQWWNRNNFYLSNEARQAFFAACHGVITHGEMLDARRAGGPVETAALQQSWDSIMQVGPLLQRGVELPELVTDPATSRDTARGSR